MSRLRALVRNAEAVQLGGLAVVSAGVGDVFGWGAGLIALGAGAVLYGYAMELGGPDEPEAL